MRLRRTHLTREVRLHTVHRMNDSDIELSVDSVHATFGPPSEGASASSHSERVLRDIDAAMHRMGRLMAARHAEFQHESGMTTPHFMLLKAVDCEGPTRVSDLAELMGVKNPAASMIVQQLESDGLVERHHDEHDNRVVIVSLTDLGERRLAQAEVFRRGLLSRMTADLSTEDLEALLRILGTVSDSVARGV